MMNSRINRSGVRTWLGPIAFASILLCHAGPGLAEQQPPPVAGPSSANAAISAEEASRRGKEAYERQDFPEALRWHRIAAAQGNAESQVAMGNMFGQGQGVPQDYAEALRWYRKAAEQGNDEAEDNIGFFYLSGWGVPRDFLEAKRRLMKSADQGNEVAQRNIGMIYLQGLGVHRDRHEAIRWFRKAAAKGDEDAKAALKYLGEK